jgi:hypothetical protein
MSVAGASVNKKGTTNGIASDGDSLFSCFYNKKIGTGLFPVPIFSDED